MKTTSKARPFISSADKAAMALTRPKGTGKEFMTELKKTKGVKPAEIEHRKLDQIEALPKMTKEDFLAELEKRPPVDVSESMLKTISPSQAAKDEASYDRYNTAYRYLTAWQRQGVDESLASAGPKFGKYQLPGGQNYREILLHLPSFGEDNRLMYLDAKKRHGGLTPQLEAELEQLKAEKASLGEEYLSSHWGPDNPNVLAHMRVSDRVGPEGKKILHVEEVQSDWHQKGRDQGYRQAKENVHDKAYDSYVQDLKQRYFNRLKQTYAPEEADPLKSITKINYQTTPETDPQKIAEVMGELDTLQDKFALMYQERNAANVGVPDAPFKKNWHELAMKRLINYASENGYDSIAITPGKEQINRYEEALRKNLDRLDYEPYKQEDTGKTLYELSGHKGGNQVFSKEDVTPEELRELVGKDMFSKIEAGHGQSLAEERPLRPNWKRIEGSDISIGGEGMKGFYDKMLPDYLNSFGKPYGAQVELGGHKLPGDPSKRAEASERLGLAGQSFADMTPEEIAAFNATLDESNATSLHHFPITPEMREGIAAERLPLYAGGGAAGSQMPQQPEEPAYAMGGAVYDTTPDMSDGGQMIQGDAFKRGGKVHFTDNLDTMFMELHDKMFKRK